MFERADDVVERVIQHLRRPVAIDPGLDARVLREIAQAPPTNRRGWPLWSALAAAAVLVAAVRRLTVDLGAARLALGTNASAAELEAGVAALRAGARPEILAHLRDLRRPPLTMALSVLADLVASGVPADSAAAAVLALARHARDADLVEFRRAVERDIALGAPPGAATSIRVNAGAENVFSGTGTNPGTVPRPRRP